MASTIPSYMPDEKLRTGTVAYILFSVYEPSVAVLPVAITKFATVSLPTLLVITAASAARVIAIWTGGSSEVSRTRGSHSPKKPSQFSTRYSPSASLSPSA